MILEFIKKWGLNAKLNDIEERSCKKMEEALGNFFNDVIEKAIKKQMGH